MKDTTNDTRKFKEGDIVFVNIVNSSSVAEKCEITGFVKKESSTNKPVEKEINDNNNIQQSVIKLAVNNLKR